MGARNRYISGSIAALALVFTLVAFQNCAPYFKPVKIHHDDLPSSDSSSSGSSSESDFIAVGELKTTDAGTAAGELVTGRVVMVRDARGTTSTYVHAIGLPPSVSNMVHVHDQPCSLGGGGHYKIDYSIAAADQANEIWPTITSLADGTGSGLSEVQHYARPEAQALVIHDAASARVACGALHSPSGATIMGGALNNLAAGTAAALTIKGSATITRAGGDGISVVRLSVSGLAPNTTYPSHVHASPCATAEGGVHYKQNINVTEVTPSPANEMWLNFTTSATGHADVRLQVPHVARADAMSIVIHDPVTPTTRLACVDLSLPGGFVVTEAAVTRGLNILGTATLARSTAGKTTVTATVTGLSPNQMYMAHVHDRRCHINAGGAHYKIDPAVATATEANEIWLHIMTDATGAGSATTTVNHLARAEAYSVIVHDNDAPTNTRLACADIF
jgi:hypothetical protein